MKKLLALLVVLGLFMSVHLHAQTSSTSDNLVAQPIPDRTVPFVISGSGISKTMQFGADMAWPDLHNFRRASMFMGIDNMNLARISYEPSYPLVNGDLHEVQIENLNFRLSAVQNYGTPATKIVMNVAAGQVDTTSYYQNSANWRDLVKATATRIQAAGYTVISVGPMNEPDYSTHQGSIDDFYNIVATMRDDAFFDDIRISAGNTLNCDEAQYWYDYMRPAGANEGNTHQLAGVFDTYASFFETVRSNGDVASNDELHNIMEALVGYEYGLQNGIWWGPAELARGEMVKAMNGERLAYAEHRDNWTVAAVYRTPEGEIQAFGGTSERQAATTTYNYISKDRVVYYDGYGPQREFVLEMPGGTGYWNGQTNAERVINITYGDDIQPVIDGRYIVVNQASGQVMGVVGSATENGSNVEEVSYSAATAQQWDVTPVDSRIGGDFSYFRFNPASNADMSLDLYNYNLDDAANVDQWTMDAGGNHQWYLDYAEDGWFYIRSRYSSKCLEVEGDGNIALYTKDGGASQKWRMLPIDAAIEFIAPGAPGDLVATAQEASIRLDWTANTESDLSGYIILRAESAAGPYNTIARGVTNNAFVDNTVLDNTSYYYKIKAQDQSLNRSVDSDQVTATSTGVESILAELGFDGQSSDASSHLNHAAVYGDESYVSGQVGTQAISLDGSDAFVQFSPDIASHQELTVATWIYWNGGDAWQRIFDFGNGQDQTMYLTPSNGSQLFFEIKNEGLNTQLSTDALSSGEWNHVAVTIGAGGISLYVNGQVAASASSTISPMDFKPVLNYIGRSQYPDPLLNASIDDFRVYNYELSELEIAQLSGTPISGYFQLQNRATGHFLDGLGLTEDGADVSQWANTVSDNAIWELIYVEDSYYQLQNKATGLFLDGMGRTTDGDACGQWANTTSYNSHWELIQVERDFYQLKNRATGLFLDNLGNADNGASVAQWANTVSNNSQWQLVDTSTARIAHVDSDTSEEVALEWYPNPVSEVLTIRSPYGTNAQMYLFNLMGEVMMNDDLDSGDNLIDVGTLKPDIYVLQITQGTNVITKRMIKR